MGRLKRGSDDSLDVKDLKFLAEISSTRTAAEMVAVMKQHLRTCNFRQMGSTNRSCRGSDTNS